MKMKRCVPALMLILMTTLAFWTAALAEEDILTLPADLTVIGEDAFNGDSAIRRVVLPDTVKEIRARAFANSGLTQINLPDSITDIDDSAFDGVASVTVTANPGSAAYAWAVKNGYINASADCPESEHPYANEADQVWTYIHPTSASMLKVTFSEDTCFEKGL